MRSGRAYLVRNPTSFETGRCIEVLQFALLGGGLAGGSGLFLTLTEEQGCWDQMSPFLYTKIKTFRSKNCLERNLLRSRKLLFWGDIFVACFLSHNKGEKTTKKKSFLKIYVLRMCI